MKPSVQVSTSHVNRNELIDWLDENIGKYEGFLDDVEFGNGWSFRKICKMEAVSNGKVGSTIVFLVHFEREDDSTICKLRFG